MSIHSCAFLCCRVAKIVRTEKALEEAKKAQTEKALGEAKIVRTEKAKTN